MMDGVGVIGAGFRRADCGHVVPVGC